MGTLLLACSLVTACSGWLDVSPKTDLKADEMFSTESGFESSLTGIYLLMTDQGAYGGNMSFGLLDQLASNTTTFPMEPTTVRPSTTTPQQPRMVSEPSRNSPNRG